MQITSLSPTYSVSAQITVNDIAALAQQGVDIVICNRPDGESADQTTFADIEQAAKNANITALLIAFSGPNFTADQVDALATQLKTGKRVHAYCRTGNRSTMIWNAVNEKEKKS